MVVIGGLRVKYSVALVATHAIGKTIIQRIITIKLQGSG